MLPEVEQIAARIRELREILELPADDVAKEIDVTPEVYKAYEAGERDIPISKLYMIATALNVDPTVLLIGDAPRMVEYTVVRQGKGIKVDRLKGYSFVSLAYNFIGREMEPMIVNLEPDSPDPRLVTHRGNEFNYVIEGRVAVILDDKQFVLDAGDSIYFDPAIPHGQKSVGGPARFITVINEYRIND